MQLQIVTVCHFRKVALLALGFALICGTFCYTTPRKANPPKRIISLSPNVTEILFALGLGDRVIGVTNLCTYPPEASAKPHVGTFLKPNIEQIVMLKPDLIVLLPSYGQTIDKFESLGLPILVVKNDTIRDVLDSIEQIASETGVEEAGEALRRDMMQSLERLRQRRESLPRKRVLFVVDKNPGTLQQIYAVGPGTFLDEILRAASAVNIMADTPTSYPIVSKEEIIARDPEVILDASIGEKPTEEQRRINRELWSQLQTVSAVKQQQIYFIEDPRITIPGPRIPESIEYLMSLIHQGGAERLGEKPDRPQLH
jgi:iron complex transport system substrate-binding protein